MDATVTSAAEHGSTAADGKKPDVLLAQITDTHITTDGGLPAQALTRVIAWINEMTPRPNALLLTGDSVNDGRPEQYAVLHTILARCRIPVYVVPGNHDRREVLRTTLPATYFPGTRGERLHSVVDAHPVRLIGLDTTAPGRLGGSLDDASLAWFEGALRAAPERPTLVFMHHPPFRTGVNAADLFGFVGLRRFRAIVARHPGIRQIVAGHIHSERRSTIGGTHVTTGLSTKPQRVPELFERGRIVGWRPEPAGFVTHAWTNGVIISTTYIATSDSGFIERRPG